MKPKPVKAWGAYSKHWGIFPAYVWPTKQRAQNYIDENLQNATDHVRTIRILISPI